jgi:hypothetical protein
VVRGSIEIFLCFFFATIQGKKSYSPFDAIREEKTQKYFDPSSPQAHRLSYSSYLPPPLALAALCLTFLFFADPFTAGQSVTAIFVFCFITVPF